MRSQHLVETGASFPRPCLARLHWDGETPPTRVEQVWNFLTIKLRDFRESLSQLHELFYGRHERTAYIKSVHSALKEVLSERRANQDLPRITNEADLKALLMSAANEKHTFRISPRKVEKAVPTIETFTNKVSLVEDRLNTLRSEFEEEILQHLYSYCSNYVSLGINDDDFYISLRSRNLSTKDIINQFDSLMEFLQLLNNRNPVPNELYSDNDFSMEVSIAVNCDTFPVLRILPDLIQKLENLCDIAQDWLRSDKVYIEQVQKEIEQTKVKLTDMSYRSHALKHQYDKVYSILKEAQANTEDDDEVHEDVCKEISKLEATKARIDMEMAAIEKTLRNTRESLNGLSSASTNTTSSTKHPLISGKLLSRRASADDATDGKIVSAAHSSHMSRLYNNLHQHSIKLDALHHKRKKVEQKIDEKRTLVVKHESRESEMQKLGKKLRLAAKNKSKYTSRLHSLQSRICLLENLLRARMRPGSSAHRRLDLDRGHSGRAYGKKVIASKRQSTKTRVPSGPRRSGHGRSMRSADLYKAFRIVKNGIGHGWKELTRSLPYAPAKELIEINNEITAIEYKNGGQLKEQSYQALIAWYGHCGKKANVPSLCCTLREMNENRLADNIEKIVLHIGSASDSAGGH